MDVAGAFFVKDRDGEHQADKTMSIQIMGAIMISVVEQFRAAFKMLLGFFDHCIINGKNNRQGIGYARQLQGKLNEIPHPAVQVDFTFI